MKIFIVLFSLAVTGLCTLCTTATNIKGTWVMQTDTGSCDPVILRIRMHEGIWQGKLDMPGEQVFDKRVAGIVVNGDSVFINIAEAGNTIKAALVNDNILAGDLYNGERLDTVSFIKLKDQ